MVWWVTVILATLLQRSGATPPFEIYTTPFDESEILIGSDVSSSIDTYATITNSSDYRLPDGLTPSKYVLDLLVTSDVLEGTNNSFTGTVAITFQASVNGTINEIKINSKVDVQEVTLLNGNTTVNITSFDTYNSTTDILTIVVGEYLQQGIDYTLQIRYQGTIGTTYTRGFYRSSYINENGTTEYLLTTQFESTYGRRAFPSFDEPQYKATFVLSITYPTGYNTLSNTELNGTTETVDSVYVKDTYLETPKMPTYLLAFVVSKFTCTEGEPIETNVPHRTCSRPGSAADRAWTNEISAPLMQQLENITGIKYSSQMTKMDQAAIPDFASGAMENWGLVTYRETGLLWNANESTNRYKQSIATVISHEFTHMWFGNLVTLQWWDYTFLNEGFARLYQYFAAAQTEELADWELDKQFVVEQVHTAFLSDSYASSSALTSASLTQTQIANKFSTIGYNKGACVLRMIQHVIGESNYLSAIQSYLSTYATGSGIPEYLWNSFAQYTSSDSLPTNVTFNEFIENWADLAGYPVVTVTADGNNVILSQNRFLLSGSSDTQWYVPITYTLSSDTDKFSNTAPQAWLIPGQNLTLENVLDGNDWIILNNLQTGFYRVNYDETLWTKIKTVLNEDHETVNVLNRAQIVDDVLNFARSGLVQFSEAFEVITYLKQETEYYPWYPAITAINNLLKRLGYDSSLGQQIQTYVLGLLENLYASVPFSTLDESNHIYTLKQVMAITRVCRYGEETCISTVKDLFSQFKSGTSVPKNLRAIVYCNALRHSDNIDEDYPFLWNYFQSIDLATELVTLLNSLGCSQNTTYINQFLDQTVNASSGIREQDFSTAWSSVYSSSSIGSTTALEYILNNYATVNSSYYSASTILSSVVDTFATEEQLALLSEYAASDALNSDLKSVVESLVTTVQSNMAWAEALREDLTSYFEETASGVSNVHINLIVVTVLLVLTEIF